VAQGTQSSPPAAPQAIPGLPKNADFLVFAGFNGIDTKPPRPGVADDKAAWMDNLMPLGENNVRSMYDIGSSIYGPPSGGRTIIHFDFYGLQPMGVNSGPYAAVFLSDGSAVAIQLSTATVTTIAGAGTFAPPTGTAIVCRQYGTTYLLIATLQGENGYWIWDGSLLYTAGTIGPEIDITDDGVRYTSAPTITAIGGSGSGATFTSTVLNGSIATITVTAPGTGWLSTDPTQVVLLFSGGGSGTSAYATATPVNGAITAVTVAAGGGSYTASSTVTVTDPGGGSGAVIQVGGLNGGAITSLTVLTPGSGYIHPVITVGSPGGGFVGSAVVEDGVISSATIVDAGSGYDGLPQPVFISATGSGASATAVLSAGTVVGLDFGLGDQAVTGFGFTGVGYTGTVIIAFQGGVGPASALVQLMPFGIQGNAIEVYQGRAWIASTLLGVKVFFTAPGSAVNFGPPDGGGAFPPTDSVLRYQWVNLLQSNGFLYLIGDSSVNYVSGVTTTGSPAITTFSNLNVDPQIGSPWRDSCITFGRSIIMANPFGIHAIYGGAVQKISTPLDGVFGTGNVANVLNGPSSATATIFGVHVYVFLQPIIDRISGSPRNVLFCWDGKRWWTAGQSVTLTKIATQEWGSDITAYGTDGTHLYPLFQTPGSIQKTLQSKQWFRPSILAAKKAWGFYALWQGNASTTLDFTIDGDNTSNAITQGTFTSSTGVGWGRSAAAVGVGMTMGFTMFSTSTDFVLVDATLVAQNPYRLKT
jgi:hypothetical protein